MTLFIVTFLAGVLTILAPCVLPVLPVILAGSVGEKQKWYPYIITASLAFSVVFFTVLLKATTLLIAIPSTFWKYFSSSILLALGLVFLFPHAWAWISEKCGLSHSGNALERTQNVNQPFLRAVLTGAALGPVFSTCSPTYAFLLATIFPSSIITGVLYTFVYALGLASMLTLIVLGGRKIIASFRVFAEEDGWFKKSLGVILVLVGLSIMTGFDKKTETYVLERFDISQVEQKLLDSFLQKTDSQKGTNASDSKNEEMGFNVSSPYPAPEFVGNDWINSNPLTMKELRGKVVIIDFWTYSCINCQRTLPYLVNWDKKYRDKGLVIVGVHAPEFAFEKKKDNVEQAIKDAHIDYPNVLDNDFRLWAAYDNHYWPAKYFIDKNGQVRHTHFGEGEYQESEKVIQELLSEGGSGAIVGEILPEAEQKTTDEQSPETYLGKNRRENFVKGNNILDLHHWNLSGNWLEEGESIEAESSARLDFHFLAKNVYLVLSGSGTVEVKVDGKMQFPGMDVKDGILTVNGDRLYHLVDAGDQKEGVLSLELSPGIKAFAFTFSGK